MNIIFKGSPNFWRDRTLNGVKHTIKKIVIHWFGTGTLESANARFQNPANQTSAHYGISQGRIWQWVNEKDAAWGAGDALVNLEAINIEHDAILNGHNLSDQDYENSGQLIARIATTYNLKLDRTVVIGHREVKATQCPGTVDIDRLVTIAKKYMAVPIDPVTFYKFSDSSTEYVLIDKITMIGVTADGLTKTLKGRTQNLVQLPATDRAKYIFVDSIVN